MKASLKSLAADMRPSPVAAVPAPQPQEQPSYKTAATRTATRTLAGHFPAEDVTAFRVLAAGQDMDVQELLGAGINMVFERYGVPNRIEIKSGRRKRS